jgi:lycopene cyclase domain-containing protein
LLALPFFAAVALVAVAAGVVAARRARAAGRRPAVGRRAAVVTSVVAGAALLVMTMVFDNVIVTLRVVAYDPARIWGAKIGTIPVEDLAYSIAAVVLLPSLWVLFDRTGSRDRSRPRDGADPRDRTRPRDGADPLDRTGARPAPDPTTHRPEDTP